MDILNRIKTAPRKQWIKFSIFMVLWTLFGIWTESFLGLVVVPFFFDIYITHYIHWTWWKKSPNRYVRFAMSWVDAITFALVVLYFINQFFFQNFVIPSSSLEKTMLTGDYLLVSKLSYGPRIPETPLYMPMTQHSFPEWVPFIGGHKSYSDCPHWEYRRLKGLGHVELGDIVVFNYPAGDTVALKAQDQDFYRLCCMAGYQYLEANHYDVTYPCDSIPYAEQQKYFSYIKNTGRSLIEQTPDQFGEIVYRPADRRENYVKRCVGLPGDTFEMRDGQIYLNGKAMFKPERMQRNYIVHFIANPTDDFLKEHDISMEDLSFSSEGLESPYHIMPLTNENRDALLANHYIDHCELAPSTGDWLYPLNKVTGWTTADYGPLWIPKAGAKLNLTLDNLPIYERCIKNYEGNTLEVRGETIYINGSPATSYTFKYDYYWMMGDNRDNSADSRFWGFVPETHIVGKPLFIWLSLDPDRGWFDGHVRWSRLFKWVANIL